MIINSSQLVLQVQKLGALSSNQAGLVPSDIYFYANLMASDLVADILKTREEYLIFKDSIPVTVGNDTYRIPYRSLGGTVRHLWFEDSSGNRTKLDPAFEENIESYSAADTDTPSRFYIFGNSIVLLPKPNVIGNLFVAYPFRPNQLVDSATTTTITLVNSPTSFNVTNAAALGTGSVILDIIDARSGNGIIAYDQPATISANTLTFSNALPTAAVGNYVALANQAPVFMAPEETHPYLLELTVLRVEQLRGNDSRAKNSIQRVQQAKATCESLLDQRVVSKPHPAGGGNPLAPQRWW